MPVLGGPEKCDVCGQEAEVRVYAMPYVPGSFAYCPECLRANAHPYGIVVNNTAMCGGLDQCAWGWRLVVHGTLRRLGIDKETFDRDVNEAIVDFSEIDRKLNEG